MDQKQIKDLLEKYYNSETSIEEEKILLEYFTGNECSEEFHADRDIFLYNSNEKESLEGIPDISDSLLEGIERSERISIKTKHKKLYWTLRVAAGIAIILASFVLVKNQLKLDSNEYKIVDTYETPEEAYEHAKETLLYVSALLNSGTDHLEPIEKINEGTQKLMPIASFNEGIKELKQVSKYQKVEKYIKQ